MSNTIKIETSDVSNIMLGSNSVNALYCGDEKVYPITSSEKWILGTPDIMYSGLTSDELSEVMTLSGEIVDFSGVDAAVAQLNNDYFICSGGYVSAAFVHKDALRQSTYDKVSTTAYVCLVNEDTANVIFWLTYTGVNAYNKIIDIIGDIINLTDDEAILAKLAGTGITLTKESDNCSLSGGIIGDLTVNNLMHYDTNTDTFLVNYFDEEAVNKVKRFIELYLKGTTALIKR